MAMSDGVLSQTKKTWWSRPAAFSSDKLRHRLKWRDSNLSLVDGGTMEGAAAVEHVEKSFKQLTDDLFKTFDEMNIQNKDLLERNKHLAEENLRLQGFMERISCRSKASYASEENAGIMSVLTSMSEPEEDTRRLASMNSMDSSPSTMWGGSNAKISEDDGGGGRRTTDRRTVRITLRQPASEEREHTARASVDLDSAAEDRDPVFPEWPLESAPRKFRRTGVGSQAEFLVSGGASRGTFLSGVEESETLEVADGYIDACMISPIGMFRLSWDMFAGIVISLQFWLTPFSLVFLPEEDIPLGFVIIETLITCFFAIDMFLNFNTGSTVCHNGTQKLLMRRSTIVQEYCRGWFWLDLVATIPFDRLFEHTDRNHLGSKMVPTMVRSVRVLRWLKLLRYIRIVRALRMAKSITKKFQLEIHRLKGWLLVPLSFLGCLVVVSHLHACIWASVQPKNNWWQEKADEPIAIGARYYESFMKVATTLVSGASLPGEDVPAMWALDFTIQIERLVLLGFVLLWMIFQAMLLLEQSARLEIIKDDALSYLKHREVSYRTQLHVLKQLHEAGELERIKRRFSTWIDSGIPYELHRAICEELWVHRLASLGLIDYVISARPRMQVELALLVREETLSSNSILFKEGDVPVAAYMILEGVIQTDSSLIKKSKVPDFAKDMWVGEKALANPALMRTVTALCKTSTTLMAVPADGFRKLLIDHEMLGEFEEYCVQHLWHGICGRCGAVGDHFANECPLIWLNTGQSEKTSASWFWGLPCFREMQITQAPEALLREAPQSRLQNSEYTLLDDEEDWSMARLLTNAKRDLKEFLRTQHLKDLTPILEERGVRSLDDLEAMSDEEVQLVIDKAIEIDQKPSDYDEADDMEDSALHVVRKDLLRASLSAANIADFRDTLEERAKEALGTIEKRAQHLVFLSHHKLHAGTEASLLRQELEIFIREHPTLRRKVIDTPVFLDSEDLSNLESLQEHVMMSHNILLLLTEEVLTRPWVLVEIATANRMGIPILPVEVRKAGNKFQYPDEQFYSKLAAGKLLPHSSMRVLESCKITILEIEAGIRKVFNRISFPYSPHRPAIFRRAEVEDLLRHCRHDFDLSMKRVKKRRQRHAKRISSEHPVKRKQQLEAEASRKSVREVDNTRKSSKESGKPRASEEAEATNPEKKPLLKKTDFTSDSEAEPVRSSLTHDADVPFGGSDETDEAEGSMSMIHMKGTRNSVRC